MTGVSTINLDPATLVDEVLGHRDGSTVRIPVDALSQQLAASGSVKDRLDQVEALAADEARQLVAADLATTASIALTGSQTIDGIPTGTGKRVLVKDQADPAQNGVWISNAAGAWARATDLDAPAQFIRASVYVSAGTVNRGGTWLQTASIVTVGTSAVNWRKIKDEAGLQAEIDAHQLEIEGTNQRTAALIRHNGPDGHPQIVDRNGVELVGFDKDGAAILRISPRSVPDLTVLLSAFLPGSDASLFPSLRALGGVELLGFDRDGCARFAVSQDVADQVGRLLNLNLIYDPVAAGFIASPDIIVFGDSMSSNAEQSAAISAALGGRTVRTLAKGGQTALGIAVCAGAMPLTITVNGGTIPGDGSPVAVTGKNVNILNNGGSNAGTARVYFTSAGISATCLIETDSAGNWTIKREVAGAAIAVAAGTQVILHPTSGTATIPATSAYRACTAVIRLGRNGTRDTRAARVANTLHPIRQLIRFLTPRVKNIAIIGPYNGRAKRASDGTDYESAGSAAYAEMMTLIEEIQREFGRLFLDMRSAAVRNAPYDIGITLTADDQADMAADCIARQLFSDDIHMGAPMRSWEGTFIGNHLAALGF